MKLTKKKLVKIAHEDCLGLGLDKVVHQLTTASVLKTGRVFSNQLNEIETVELKEVMSLDGRVFCNSSFRKFEETQMMNEYTTFIKRTDLRDYLCKIKSSLYLIKTERHETVGYVMEMAETDTNPFDLPKKQKRRWCEIQKQLTDVHEKNVGLKRGTNKLVCIDYGMGEKRGAWGI